MRKLTPLFLSILVVTGCKKEKKAEKAPPPDEGKAGTITEPTPPEPEAPKVVKLDGFQTPESVLWDEENDVYLVSNINGTPFDRDDNGFIAKVSPPPDAKLVEPAWIDGKNEKVTLNAPKGMALVGDLLYVADIDTVRMFDRKTGEPKGEVKLKGATFLNDLAAGKDAVYASDTALDKDFKPLPTQAVWEIRDGKGKKLVKGADLGGPNGLLVQGEDVWVVTFASGEIFKIGKGGKREAVEKLPKGQLDGIVAGPDGRLFVTSWEGSAVISGQPGNWAVGPEGVTSPADLAIDTKRNLLVVPIFRENRVEIHPVPPASVAVPEDAAKPAGGEAMPGDATKAPADR